MKRGIAKSQFILLGLFLLSGCASSGPPLPPSLEIPSPVSDLRALRKGDKVYLAWTAPTRTTDRLLITQPGSILVCRTRESGMNDCGTPVGELKTPVPGANSSSRKQRPVAVTDSYVDDLHVLEGIGPEDQITYAVEALNDRHRSAGLSNRVTVPSLPAIVPPPGFEVELTAQGVKISWECPSSMPQFANVTYRLRIYRRLEGRADDDKIADQDITQCQGVPILDTSFEWEKTYDYRAAVATLLSAPGKSPVGIEGEDTPAVRIFAHDVFPPAVPSSVQAVFSGPGQRPFVDLVWSPDTDADFAGYNVYRREENGQAAKVNSELVKTPAYRDANVESGKKYFYSVSAVDSRGNESARSEEATEAVP
jgi:hypothetical protein